MIMMVTPGLETSLFHKTSGRRDHNRMYHGISEMLIKSYLSIH